ncbi:hypothetical protein vseg_007813 [Gypsophila vaccaria]
MGGNKNKNKSKKKNKKKKKGGGNGELRSEKIMVHTINKEEKFVYGEFFTINLGNGEIEECPYVLTGGDHGLNSMVRIGSTVYVVGGLELADGEWGTIKPPNSHTNNKKALLFHRGMSFLDLNSGSGWNSAPCHRATPDYLTVAVSLGGKIYSFVSCDSAGIFDPVSQTWVTLFPPPGVGSFVIKSGTEFFADPDNNRLLVFFPHPVSEYFSYYPDENLWVRDFNYSFFPPPYDHMLLADGGLFFIYLPKYPLVFKVYDSVSLQWLNVGFTSEVPFSLWRCKFETMLHLGNGLLCLTTYSPGYDHHFTPPRYVTNVFVSKFRYIRSLNDLLFTSFPVETYPLNSKCTSVAHYFPI